MIIQVHQIKKIDTRIKLKRERNNYELSFLLSYPNRSLLICPSVAYKHSCLQIKVTSYLQLILQPKLRLLGSNNAAPWDFSDTIRCKFLTPRVVHQSQFQNLKLGYHQIPGSLVDHLLVYQHKVLKDQMIFQMGFHNHSVWRMKHQQQLLSLKQLHSYLQIQIADTCPRMLSKREVLEQPWHIFLKKWMHNNR